MSTWAEDMWDDALKAADYLIQNKQFNDEHRDIIQLVRDNPAATVDHIFKLYSHINMLLNEIKRLRDD